MFISRNIDNILGGILVTMRISNPEANEDLFALLRSGVDLLQLAAHIRNARQALISKRYTRTLSMVQERLVNGRCMQLQAVTRLR
jgi:hypothetical protein